MPTAPPPGPATATPPVGATGTSSEYDIRGMITEVAADRRSVTLDHEAIPGLMPAMKMEYRVSRANVLKGLAAGDRVHGRLQVKGTDYVVTSLARP
jgi:Cu/Ag efflux protein CusF